MACKAVAPDWLASLPTKPYCTDELGLMLVRPKAQAITKRYIQVNRPQFVTYLVFDVDREGAALAWYDAHLPPPYWSSTNPKNGHAHLCYRLAIPYPTSELAHLAPIKYAAAVQSAFRARLKADTGYAGLLTKNPLHNHWKTVYWSHEAYTLDYLADFVDLSGHPVKGRQAIGLGRNCDTFDVVRKWAYKAIREYWKPHYQEAWFNAVLARCEAVNLNYVQPMQPSEVRSIAKSVAKWTMTHFTPQQFSDSQARKGHKGGKVGGSKSKGGGRPKGSVSVNSIEQIKPWEELGISRSTYFRRKQKNKM
ncbi:TPA: replication initiation protein [Photobacterium damselae]